MRLDLSSRSPPPSRSAAPPHNPLGHRRHLDVEAKLLVLGGSLGITGFLAVKPYKGPSGKSGFRWSRVRYQSPIIKGDYGKSLPRRFYGSLRTKRG
jgi:hypothetical protein